MSHLFHESRNDPDKFLILEPAVGNCPPWMWQQVKPKNSQRDLHLYALALCMVKYFVEVIKSGSVGWYKEIQFSGQINNWLNEIPLSLALFKNYVFLKNYSRPNRFDMIILNSSWSQHPSLAFLHQKVSWWVDYVKAMKKSLCES